MGCCQSSEGSETNSTPASSGRPSRAVDCRNNAQTAAPQNQNFDRYHIATISERTGNLPQALVHKRNDELTAHNRNRIAPLSGRNINLPQALVHKRNDELTAHNQNLDRSRIAPLSERNINLPQALVHKRNDELTAHNQNLEIRTRIQVPYRIEPNLPQQVDHRKNEDLTFYNRNFDTTALRKAVNNSNDAELSTSNEIRDNNQGLFERTDDENDEIWDEVEVLCETVDVSQDVAYNFIELLSQGCTLPFIARYRKYKVEYLMPDVLQDLFENYEKIRNLKKQVKAAILTLKKASKLTPDVKKRLLNARNLAEFNLVYGPLKSHTLTLAEKARKLGLEPHAVRALNGAQIDLKSLCGANEEISSVKKVEDHLTHLVADIIQKDARVMEKIRYLKEETNFLIQSTRRTSTNDTTTNNDRKINPISYTTFFDWKCLTKNVKPHRTLALNRGEEAKILTVKVVVPEWFYEQLERYCLSLWKSSYWVKKGLRDAYNRFITPWLSKEVRLDLTTLAHKEAVKIFVANLENLLLTEPVKNRNIAGLDPGFRHGCKLGMIDRNGKVLEVCVLYPDFESTIETYDAAANQLQRLLRNNCIEIIGLGNGTACRETEMWLRNHEISNNYPVIIVPEQGASIYSVSREAQKEFPGMDPNLISAVSIARRVLDPLGELIKVDPKNLGIGLYQHDIPAKILEAAVDYTVQKIVSLVGVDINTTSLAMLRRISGLDETLAKNIMEYRKKIINFTCRTQVLRVPGITEVKYQQCIGFLKVLGGIEPLDSTIIHPESYSIAKLFAKKVGINLGDLNAPNFPKEVERKTSRLDVEVTSRQLGTDSATLELIINAFKQKHYEDNVISFCRPVYSVTVQSPEQITEGVKLTGVVRNVVPFGCFVDCGIGQNGLLHRNHVGQNRSPKLGDRVSVTVLSSVRPNKIQYKLNNIID